MNNGSTNVPGMGGGNGNIYQRQPGNQPRQGTVVPGMNMQAPNVAQQQQGAPQQPAVPVVGFLYSISRQGFGEFWPLHVGTNTIGRAEDSQICLREQTVSEHHASLFIRQMKSSRKLIASIRDEGSKNGIFVNNEELTYDAFECHNRDLITIGNNYQLLLILIDADEMGLTVSENFTPTDGQPALPQQQAGPQRPFGGQQPPQPPFQPQNPMQPMGGTQAFGPMPGGPQPGGPMPGGPQPGPNPMYDPSRRQAGGTMSLDGTIDNQPGGTQFLQ